MAASEGVIDPREFRNALGRFATGVTVVTTEVDGATHGMTANAFMSISLNPPLVAVAIDNRAKINPFLEQSGRFGVSILAVHHDQVSMHFAGRPQADVEFHFVRRHETPLIQDAVAHIVAQVVAVHPAGDHTLYVGQVEYLDWQDGHPLLFYAGK